MVSTVTYAIPFPLRISTDVHFCSAPVESQLQPLLLSLASRPLRALRLFSRSRSSFQLLSRHPLMIPHPTTLIANSPAPPDLLHFHSRIHFPLSPHLYPTIFSFSALFQILFSCFRTLHSVRPLVILRPYYSISFLCYSTPELRYCRDS